MNKTAKQKKRWGQQVADWEPTERGMLRFNKCSGFATSKRPFTFIWPNQTVAGWRDSKSDLL